MLLKSDLFNPKPYKLGLTLSGGGAKCMAQIGMLQYLDEHGVEPDIISGASGGAVIGALYSAGYAPKRILSFFTDSKMFTIRSLSFTTMGLIDSAKMRSHFEKWFPNDHFDALQKPLYVVATDLNKAKSVVFSSGPLIQVLLASSAYPGMFTPVSLDGSVYADGGIINNYPTDIIHEQCQHHMGMYLAPVTKKPSDHFSNAFDVMDRVFQIYSSAQLLSNIDLPEISIFPNGIEEWGAFMVKNDQLETLFDMGYQSTKEFFENEGTQWLEQIKRLKRKKSLVELITGRH